MIQASQTERWQRRATGPSIAVGATPDVPPELYVGIASASVSL